MSNYAFTTLSVRQTDRPLAMARMYAAVQSALNAVRPGAGDALPSIADVTSSNTLTASDILSHLRGTIDLHVHLNEVRTPAKHNSEGKLVSGNILKGHSADLLLDTSKAPGLEAETVLTLVAKWWAGTARALTKTEWTAGADASAHDADRPVLVRDGVFLWLVIDQPRHTFAGFRPLTQEDLEAERVEEG